MLKSGLLHRLTDLLPLCFSLKIIEFYGGYGGIFMINKLLNLGITKDEIIEIISKNSGMEYLEWLLENTNSSYSDSTHIIFRECFFSNLHDDNYFSYKAWTERHDDLLKRHSELKGYDCKKLDFIIKICEFERIYWSYFDFLVNKEISQERMKLCYQCQHYNEHYIPEECFCCNTYVNINEDAKLKVKSAFGLKGDVFF